MKKERWGEPHDVRIGLNQWGDCAPAVRAARLALCPRKRASKLSELAFGWCGLGNSCHTHVPRISLRAHSDLSRGLVFGPKRLKSRSAGRRSASCLVFSGCRMTNLLADYLPLVIFIGVSLLIGVALLVAPFIVAYSRPDTEKLSAYECGFNAFDDARMKFDVRFYLVAILFIIFDLEVAFLFPWAITFGGLGWFGFWSMMIFLGVLTVGFVYEWKKGALEWD
jgi:NADH-quinone oxidoreductase subunit A